MTNHFLFMSYSFPIQVLIHFSFIPIHSLFILAPFISKVFQKKGIRNERKWNEVSEEEKKANAANDPIQNLESNTFTNTKSST